PGVRFNDSGTLDQYVAWHGGRRRAVSQAPVLSLLRPSFLCSPLWWPGVNDGPAEVMDAIIGVTARVLVTGATGFLGARVVASLLERGFHNVRCFARQSSDVSGLETTIERSRAAGAGILRGN